MPSWSGIALFEEGAYPFYEFPERSLFGEGAYSALNSLEVALLERNTSLLEIPGIALLGEGAFPF